MLDAEIVAVVSNHLAENLVLEYLRDIGITEQEPAIEKRCIRLHVRFIKFLEVVGMADLMADFELQIPQRMQHRFDCVFFNSIFEEKQQIHIGLRMNRGAPVPADGHQRE